jgi:hypothetical protein
LLIISLINFHIVALGTPVSNIYAPEGAPISAAEIDGVIGTEWNDAGGWVSIDLGILNNIRAKHDSEYLYILLVIGDNTDNPFPEEAHDWAGVDFDLNGDEKTMGDPDSPDDFEYCDYQILGGEDWWGKGVGEDRGSDTSVGGTNDVVAAKGFNTTHTIWEFKKKLNSGDTLGHDIAMDPTQTEVYGKDRIKIALAYQDGKTGKHGYHSSWYLLILTVPPPVTYGADLVKRSAWPEHRHFDRSAELAKGEDLNNTLYGLVRNTGTVNVYVKVKFTIYNTADDTMLGYIDTDPYLLTLAEYEHVLIAGFDTTYWATLLGIDPDMTKYKVRIEAQAWYQDPADLIWKTSPDSGIKTFSFAVVP